MRGRGDERTSVYPTSLPGYTVVLGYIAGASGDRSHAPAGFGVAGRHGGRQARGTARGRRPVPCAAGRRDRDRATVRAEPRHRLRARHRARSDPNRQRLAAAAAVRSRKGRRGARRPFSASQSGAAVRAAAASAAPAIRATTSLGSGKAVRCRSQPNHKVPRRCGNTPGPATEGESPARPPRYRFQAASAFALTTLSPGARTKGEQHES